jgi:hypothetical protein
MRNYGYLLVALALLAGYLRLTRAQRFAAAQVARRENPYHTVIQKSMAVVLLLGAVALAVLASIHRERPWLWLGVMVAALSGAQALASAILPAEKLATVVRAIGAAFIVLALVMYFMLVRA